MKIKLIIAFFISFSAFCKGGDSLNAGNSFSLLVGQRAYNHRIIGTGNDKLDFFEYLHNRYNPKKGETYIGLEIRKSIKNKHFVSFVATSHDDIEMINFDLKYGRLLHKNIGLSVGINKFNMPTRNSPPFDFENEFEDYKTEQLTTYNRYEFLKNYSISINPFYRFRNRFFWIEGGTSLGIGALGKNEKDYSAQNPTSFEVIRVQYATKPSLFIFAEPKIQVGLFPFQLRKSQIGFQLKASAMPSRRSYNYKRQIDIWTADDPIKENVIGPKYKINRFEVDFGLVWKN